MISNMISGLFFRLVADTLRHCSKWIHTPTPKMRKKSRAIAKTKTVTFATSVWEKDWRQVLLNPEYLPKKQIGNHCYPFAEKLLVINNVADYAAVYAAALKWVEKGVLTRIVKAEEWMLVPFQLKRTDFTMGADAHKYDNVNNDWIYFNALGPLAAIYACKSDYLLYHTGDVRLDQPVDWIQAAIDLMETHNRFRIANLVWNGKYDEAKKESYRKKGRFYLAREGFSDQMFLARRETLFRPIYREIRADSDHFPRGDVFEKRVFSYMKNRGWERIIYNRGSYTHENFL